MEETRAARKAFGRIGIGYTGFLSASIVLQIVLRIFIYVVNREGILDLSRNWYLFATSLANYAAGGMILFLIIKNMPVTHKPVSRKADKNLLVCSYFICITALIAGNLLGRLLMSLISALEGRPMVNPVTEVLKGLSTGTIFAIMVVMAPVCEEILFRRLIIDRIRRYGDKAAILVSAVIFGLCHGNFYQFFYAFGIGLVFGYIYTRTGRIRYTIVFHMIINFLGSVAAIYIQKSMAMAAIYALVLYGSMIAGIVLFIIKRKDWMFWQGEEAVWGRGAGKILFLNVGIVLFFILSAISFVITEFA
ncbi:CPBP family intramembrane glutamic endopeptidase [Clostridium boliviensis]|uniref:CPBP family intramembrane glutamic endopeptidase n=1 Tax=Clostridium boliviensis TaxID=318465 RepID=A0ABU4GH52_9CLOT|nr:CPBP family intramembrane glutamic endopeptidase [Clostridium boliviensis]MDW2796955.1 CPBP family intramembrane glutamic endopeptidase [Clostridium boliviensis]